MTISVPASMGISGEGTKTAPFPGLTLAVGCLLPQQLLEPSPLLQTLMLWTCSSLCFSYSFSISFSKGISLTKLSSVIRSPEATAMSQNYQSLCGYRRIVESCYNLRAGIFFFHCSGSMCVVCTHVLQHRWRFKWISDPLVWVQISWRCWNVCKTSDALLVVFFINTFQFSADLTFHFI